MASLKEQLHILCFSYISSRETEIKNTINEIRDASANETKSSAGDKYETTRELMQQEIDLNQARLNELSILRSTLERISPNQKGNVAQAGSVVATNNGNFYLAISAGQLKLNGTIYYAISAASPLGLKLTGQKAGYSFELNKKLFTITEVI